MKRSFNILLAGLAAVSLASCNKSEPVFDETVSERITQTITQYKSALLLCERWVLEYFPDEDLAYGGWVYVLEFRDGQIVKAWFEGSTFVPKTVFASDPPITESEYQVEFSTGPMLKFITHNDYLHYFAYPDATNGGYRGWEGDFEFTFMSMSPGLDEIVLRGSRTKNKMRMTPLSGEYTPESYIAAVRNDQLAVAKTQFKVISGDEQIGTIEREEKVNLNYFDRYYKSKIWTLKYSYQKPSVGTNGKPLTDEEGFPVYETVEVSDKLCVIHLPGGVMKLYAPYTFEGDATPGLAGQSIHTFKWTLGETSASDGYVCSDPGMDIKLVP